MRDYTSMVTQFRCMMVPSQINTTTTKHFPTMCGRHINAHRISLNQIAIQPMILVNNSLGGLKLA